MMATATRMDKQQLRERLVEIQETLLRVEEDVRRLRVPHGEASRLRLDLENGTTWHAPTAFTLSLESAEGLIYSLLWQLDTIAELHGLPHLPFRQAPHERIAYQDAMAAATTN